MELNTVSFCRYYDVSGMFVAISRRVVCAGTWAHACLITSGACVNPRVVAVETDSIGRPEVKPTLTQKKERKKKRKREERRNKIKKKQIKIDACLLHIVLATDAKQRKKEKKKKQKEKLEVKINEVR